MSGQLARVNKRMIELLEEARKALRGEGNFGVEEIRKLREPLNEMDPVRPGNCKEPRQKSLHNSNFTSLIWLNC